MTQPPIPEPADDDEDGDEEYPRRVYELCLNCAEVDAVATPNQECEACGGVRHMLLTPIQWATFSRWDQLIYQVERLADAVEELQVRPELKTIGTQLERVAEHIAEALEVADRREDA